MRFHVVTIFPEMLELATRFGVVGQAVKDGVLSIDSVNPRVFTHNNHQTVDDRPFGGGDGMVMMAEPLSQAVESILSKISDDSKRRVIHLSPRGRPFTDSVARELLNNDDLVLIASRYGGVDQRFLNSHVDEEISVGDFVLSGGELPALTLIDAISRLLPGVLGNQVSSEDESFAMGLLEYPQYTRPREWRGVNVPDETLSGDHARIAAWKRQISLVVTAFQRPDLLSRVTILDASLKLTERDITAALKRLIEAQDNDLLQLGLKAQDRARSIAALQELLLRVKSQVKNLKKISSELSEGKLRS